MVMNRVVVERKSSSQLEREEKLIVSQAVSHRCDVYMASDKQMERKRFVMDIDTMAVGSISFVKHALRQLDKSLPIHAPYPDVLSHLLHREVRYLDALLDAKSMVARGERLFIKPADGWKRFTGFVAESESDYRFGGASNWKPVWISEPVEFVSEWRVYVTGPDILDIRFSDHGGDKTIRPEPAVIVDAVSALYDAGKSLAGYCIDFGVLKDGRTALIEMNDGFSFGAYDGLPSEVYWKVTTARWAEMVNTPVVEII
jgi:hypothetical protein